VILLILAAVWIVVLAPAAWKRFSGRHAGASIASFHQELRLLERSGPKLIAPAFRLETAYAGASPAPSRSGFPAVSSMPGRPSLVLLEPNVELADPGPDHMVDAAAITTGHGSRGASGGSAEGRKGRPKGRSSPRAEGRDTQYPALQAGRDVAAGMPTGGAVGGRARRAARRRRRNILAFLLGAVVITAILGFERSLRPAWVVTALAAAALMGFVALAACAQHIVATSRRPQVRRRPPARVRDRRSDRVETDRWARFEDFYDEVGGPDEDLEQWEQAAAY